MGWFTGAFDFFFVICFPALVLSGLKANSTPYSPHRWGLYILVNQYFFYYLPHLSIICKLWRSKPNWGLHFMLPSFVVMVTNIGPLKTKLTKLIEIHRSQPTNRTFWQFCVKHCFFFWDVVMIFAAVKNETVGWVLNFRVRMLLKRCAATLLRM